MVMRQLILPIDTVRQPDPNTPYREQLTTLLGHDLDFHAHDSGYASHNLHSFPAKFPPQIPRKFIRALTSPGDLVLDPMMGSGTAILEALLARRQGCGFDIDPLAVLISTVKSTPLDGEKIFQQGETILRQATLAAQEDKKALRQKLQSRWDARTRKFVDYWFFHDTQIELQALMNEIECIPDTAVRTFFELVFSAIIITKSSSVSLAIDIAHTRPHRAKILVDQDGQVIWENGSKDIPSSRIRYVTKQLRSPLHEFHKQLKKGVRNLLAPSTVDRRPFVAYGNAQSLPLEDEVVDLIVTSPPYPAYAIDYMRSHKFSLVWLGFPIKSLGEKRREYIGGEAITDIDFEALPSATAEIIGDIADHDEKKGMVLRRYYSEMKRTLQEMYRVLKLGKSVVVVVGRATMRGQDTQTPECLVDIGQDIGFEIPRVGVRHLDRDRRMMPTGSKVDTSSQIQQRMHEEYVIGFYKPA